jgi:hypothetical protein
MSTSKPYHSALGSVSFKAPTIGPHMYLAEASISGWPEAFDRAKADRALLEFIMPLAVEELIETFQVSAKLATDKTNWNDITSFLAKITNQPQTMVPTDVGVAFWAHVLLADTQQGMN